MAKRSKKWFWQGTRSDDQRNRIKIPKSHHNDGSGIRN